MRLVLRALAGFWYCSGMTDSIIERAARALARRNYPSGSDADIAEMAEGFTPDVIAVLQAIREPSDVMCHAGDEIQHDDDCTDVAAIYQAMIDKALSE